MNDPAWGFVVLLAPDGTAGFVNTGGCVAARTDEGCGAAVHYEERCLQPACECARNAAELDECRQKARTLGPCSSVAGEAERACDEAGSARGWCAWPIVALSHRLEIAKAFCGPNDADAGR